MNDTPTPRTDALMPDQGHKRTIYEHIQVMETHARQLERELAEAKAELKKYTTDSGDDSLYNVRRLRKELTDITKQRDSLAEALELFLSRVRYTSVFMNGNPTGGTFDYRSHGFDAEVELAHKALEATKGESHENTTK